MASMVALLTASSMGAAIADDPNVDGYIYIHLRPSYNAVFYVSDGHTCTTVSLTAG